MSKPTLYVQRLSEAAVLPKRGSALAAGWDLAAANACVVPAKGRAIVASAADAARQSGGAGGVEGAAPAPPRAPAAARRRPLIFGGL